MKHSDRLQKNGILIAMVMAVAGIAVWTVLAAKSGPMGIAAASRAALRRPTGYPQLVSSQPLLGIADNALQDGEMCQWAAGGPETLLVSALRQGQSGALASAEAIDQGKAAVDADRAPVRVIRDTFPTYSAIAVDANSNEVFLEDENLFGIKVFNRTDNTPPSAGFTEPKRMIGGRKTKLEFNCGLYIDPRTGDIYSVPNDTVDTLVVFPHDAKGNVAPERELKTPHGTYGIAVDENAQELYLTVEHINAVVVYPKTASGETKPLRTLEGNQTLLEDPHGIALDVKNNLMFVSNHGNAKTRTNPGTGLFKAPSITVYPLQASGDTAPLRVIEGPRTQLNWPAHVYLDPEHGELFVANDAADSILVFRETDSGNAAPLRVIKGTKTGLKNPTDVFLDTKNQELWASNMGNHSATVFARTANGDVAPLRTIRSAPIGQVALAIGNPGGAGYDSKREQILVPN